jgi:hypothetical protein
MPVILWTDALVFLLTLVVVIFILHARRKPHLRAPWHRVFTGQIAAASVVVLLAFVLIGLLDSLHFRLPLKANGTDEQVHHAVEVLSVLDVLVGPLRTRVEKTYSAPFATHLFSRETVEQPDGSQLGAISTSPARGALQTSCSAACWHWSRRSPRPHCCCWQPPQYSADARVTARAACCKTSSPGIPRYRGTSS